MPSDFACRRSSGYARDLSPVRGAHAGDPVPPGDSDDPESGLALKTRTRVKKPSMYRVLMLNDDYTPMEFVIDVLERFFDKSHEEATEIMLSVHNSGVGLCGIYTFEIAETKVGQVMALARRAQHPLQCTLEKE